VRPQKPNLVSFVLKTFFLRKNYIVELFSHRNHRIHFRGLIETEKEAYAISLNHGLIEIQPQKDGSRSLNETVKAEFGNLQIEFLSEFEAI
jgi:hypothetical protein